MSPLQELTKCLQQDAAVERIDQRTATVPTGALHVPASRPSLVEPGAARGRLPLLDVHHDLLVRAARVPARHSRLRIRLPPLHELLDPDPRCEFNSDK